MRIGFKDKVLLFEAIYGEKCSSQLSRGLIQLNTIRNTLAHNFDPSDIDDKVARFNEIMEQSQTFDLKEGSEINQTYMNAFFATQRLEQDLRKLFK